MKVKSNALQIILLTAGVTIILMVGLLAAVQHAQTTAVQQAQTGAVQPAQTGAVQGMVVAEDGRPIGRVRVYSFAENGAHFGIDPYAITDDAGNFLLERLLPGENRLFPVFTEAGYPDGRSGIFANAPAMYQMVTVESGRTTAGVVLRLPQKGALFRTRIIDVSTGEPVLSSRIRITRPDVPGVFYEAGPNLKGEFEIVLVPNVPFKVTIGAPNYKEWRYSEMDGQHSRNLNLLLRAGDIKETTAKLQGNL
jgi:hypothetical protein